MRELAARSTASVPLTVLPLVAGVHSLSGLKLLEASGKTLTSLEASGDILVQMDAGSWFDLASVQPASDHTSDHTSDQ